MTRVRARIRWALTVLETGVYSKHGRDRAGAKSR